MEIKKYQELSVRTMNTELTLDESIVNMIMGLNGEIGEVTELFKKEMFHGKQITEKEYINEIGDVFFYLVNLCTLIDVDVERVLDSNFNKLLTRYPNGFSYLDSEKRVDIYEEVR